MDPSSYCREIEAYLCRKNDGHLIRIVGPAFEQVCGWAERGVPIKVAFRGIDRTFERYYAKGPRRRPVRVEFCEADVLDEFDAWRRAMGPALADAAAPVSDASTRPSLPRHLDRVLTSLTALRAGRVVSPAFAARVDGLIDEVDAVRAGAKTLRGEARARALARLAALDGDLMAAARDELAAERDALVREAEDELKAFRARMPREAWTRAVDAGVDRLIRERLGLPVIEVV